jgi:hypothetical protein
MRTPVSFAVVAVVAALFLAAVAFAGPWGPAPCPPVGGPVAPAMAPLFPVHYEWRDSGEDNWTNLLFGGRQVGSWHRYDGFYRPLHLDGTFGPPGPPPVPAPALAVRPRPAPARAELPTGVDLDKIGPSRITLNGVEVTREAAAGVILPDDRSLLRVTVIGTEAACRQVTADLAASEWKGKVLVQEYRPAEWAVKPGFVTTGNPTIYCQAPDGRVLHRQDDYEGGLPALAGALRKADPKYDPAKDPDLRKPAPVAPEPPTPLAPKPPRRPDAEPSDGFKLRCLQWLEQNPLLAAALAAAMAFLVWQRRQQKP